MISSEVKHLFQLFDFSDFYNAQLPLFELNQNDLLRPLSTISLSKQSFVFKGGETDKA